MLTALAGGVLIGLAATLFWAVTGRVAGVSGLLEQADTLSKGLEKTGNK